MINILLYILDNLISLHFYIINFGLSVYRLVSKAKDPYDFVHRMYIYNHVNGHELLYNCIKIMVSVSM